MSQKIEFHPDAASNFSEKIGMLFNKVAPQQENPSLGHRPGFHPDTYASVVLTEKDIIGEPLFAEVDQSGTEVARYFGDGHRRIGLYGEEYKRLRQIAEGIQRLEAFHSKVSVVFLVDVIFEWIKRKHKKETIQPPLEFLLTRCDEAIKEFVVWVPIASLHVQSDVRIGKVVLKTVAREMFDRWRTQSKMGDAAIDQEQLEFYDREQKKLQGLAAATMTLDAEPHRAAEIAFEEAEKSLGILRFYCGANFYPETRSYCVPLGKENRESETHFLLSRDGDLQHFNSSLVDRASGYWIVDDAFLSFIKRDGLDVLSDLLLQGTKTNFQEDFLSSLLLFSKNTLTNTLSDKLVYVLVALESLLLKNENEPIQQNIAERMAFVIGRSAVERKAIIENVKKTYGVRSRFIHHGHTIQEMELVRTFMLNAWAVFQTLICNVGKFSTKQELIDAIENRKLS